MASIDPSSCANIHNSFTSSATTFAPPFATQLSSEKRSNKPRVLLRVKRLRHFQKAANTSSSIPNAVTDSEPSANDDCEQGGPVKKRKIDQSPGPEIIRLTLPTNTQQEEEIEQSKLISRLSSAISLYGDETTVDSGPTLPSTPSRSNGNEMPSSKTPMKPKRNVTFRRLNDISKVLHSEGGETTHEEWNSKGEERSKWLRVVDVKLHEHESQESEERTGPRLPKMRGRSITENDEERSGKRRKLGLTVEASCTMPYSEFLTNTTHDTSELDQEMIRLIDNSLQTLHNQNGGTVSPFLSFLKLDPRLGSVSGTVRARQMINHKLREHHGRTVLHYAAAWGDVAGIRAALEIGADSTILDDLGHTPAALAELQGDQEALLALLEAESHIKNKEDDYYYEVYCLEEEAAATPAQVKVDRNLNTSPNAASFTTSESEAMDSPPDLIRMDGHRMSEDDDSCALMELQNGFGYWNERGELILEASKHSCSAASSVAYAADDVCESSGEDVSIDYPDEQSEENNEIRDSDHPGIDFGMGSDYDDYFDADARVHNYSSEDDSDADWKLDFRNRFVPKYDGSNSQNEHSEDELSSGGFGTNRNRLHGWEYSRGLSDGESDDDYAGPMLG